MSTCTIQSTLPLEVKSVGTDEEITFGLPFRENLTYVGSKTISSRRIKIDLRLRQLFDLNANSNVGRVDL